MLGGVAAATVDWSGRHTHPPALAQVSHRQPSHSGDMTTPADGQAREDRIRRTRLVRRGVVAAGATGALGAAVAIGATIHTAEATDAGSTDDQTAGDQRGQGFDQRFDDDFDQPPQVGQLAGPGGGGVAQGHSAGS